MNNTEVTLRSAFASHNAKSIGRGMCKDAPVKDGYVLVYSTKNEQNLDMAAVARKQQASQGK